MLKGKKIILGITGSIAAYKAAYLLRLLKKEGADVQVLMTKAGKEFITPVTLSALSDKPVLGEFFQTKDGTWNSHVDLGLWADLMVIAPASANTIAKMATGICDNLLLTTYLSAKCPIMIAPAMDLDMFEHDATQKNLKTLADLGCTIIEPGTGELASGLFGKGRMEDPEIILERIISFFNTREYKSVLKGKKVMVTAGPTYEHIDQVRFIGNHSSGKMGYAIARELAEKGANVILITGPVNENLSHQLVDVVKINSAEEMYTECSSVFDKVDVAIFTAAVADYTPVDKFSGKLKRKNEELSIKLKPTKDIAAEMGKRKSSQQVLVGFALETDNLLVNAQKKLKSKNLDFIVVNSAVQEDAGFYSDTNQITIIDKNNNVTEYSLKHKHEVAKDIIDQLENIFERF